jgi:hypothetical protein
LISGAIPEKFPGEVLVDENTGSKGTRVHRRSRRNVSGVGR